VEAVNDDLDCFAAAKMRNNFPPVDRWYHELFVGFEVGTSRTTKALIFYEGLCCNCCFRYKNECICTLHVYLL
jgi:hypothetical protein